MKPKSYQTVVAEILNQIRPSTILDAPSGTGWLRNLLNFDTSVDGIDLFEQPPPPDTEPFATPTLISAYRTILAPTKLSFVVKVSSTLEAPTYSLNQSDGTLIPAGSWW